MKILKHKKFKWGSISLTNLDENYRFKFFDNKKPLSTPFNSPINEIKEFYPNSLPRKLFKKYFWLYDGMHWGSKVNPTLRFRSYLNYPLNFTWMIDAKVKFKEIGEIFGIVNDSYRFIYLIDDKAWRKSGFDKAPRLKPGMHNRAYGKHVYGHDFGDLAFEWVDWYPINKLPKKYPRKDYYDIGYLDFAIGS